MFTILTKGPWSQRQIRITWTDSTRRIDPRVEDQIAHAWSQASARLGDKLFDGPMCRLENWSASPAELRITLSRTSYRPFLGTNLANAACLTPDVMANPVGLSTALETSDGWLLLGRRNDSVAYYPNRVHPFAGALEPADSLDVVQDVRRELREELAMTSADIADIRCLGMAEDLALRQPELIFHVLSTRTRREIESNLDPAEHVATYALRAADVRSAKSIDDPILTPVAAASLVLWKS
jgi:8-oxo-dGTP pyrophosphatase MutT (NUDIX family)